MDWALATTAPNAEHLVSDALERFGYEHWIFRRKVSRARRGKIVNDFLPAFPRYVMVPFEQCWEVVRDVWQIIGIVCFGGHVARVREHDFNYLVERCGGGCVIPPEQIPERWARGERIHIGGVGLVAGHDAYYEGLLGDGRLRVMTNMLGRLVPVDVDERDVFSIVSRRKRRRPGRRNRHRKAN
jgi:transcription antitermination factor NusG